MRRSEALLKLSREHHTGLILAQLLKKNAPPYKGLPETPEQKADYSLSMMRTHLLPHFEQEETIIAYLDAKTDIYKSMHERILSEHAGMKQLCDRFRAGDGEPLDLMDEFGRMLEKHIRFEEREYFEYLQKNAGEEDFDYIQSVLEK